MMLAGLLLAVVLGSLVTLVLDNVIPIIGHLMGGFIAGYLAGGEASREAVAGFLAGLLGFIVLAILFLLIGSIIVGLLGAFPLAAIVGGGSLFIILLGIPGALICAIGGAVRGAMKGSQG